MENYDIAIIGAGPAGYVAALRAGLAGLKTTLIEKSRLGGTCLNRGCIPTKAMLAAVLAAWRAGHASAVGLRDTPVTFSDDGAYAHARRTVEMLARGVEALLKKRSVAVIVGEAAVREHGAVEVETASGRLDIRARNVIIATGSVPAFPKGLEPDGKVVLSSDDVLERDLRPGASLAVIGGGVVGLELAQYYALTGRQVTIVEMLDRILPMATPAASKELARALKKIGVKIAAGRRVERLNRKETSAEILLDDGSHVVVDTVLCAVGRRPSLSGIDLAALGISQHKTGRIATGERGRVARGLHAVGDVAGETPMLAHAASHQGIAAVEDILGLSPDAKPEPVASVVYTHPEVAWVGKVPTDEQAEKATRSAAFPLRALGRAHTLGETSGYVTLYLDGNKVIGADLVGEGVGEIVGTVALGIRLGATADDFARIPFPHPTFSEALMEAAFVALGLPIHTV